MKTGGGINYTYDGSGNRVEKSNGKLYWYGPANEVLDESDSSGNITDEYVFFGGSRIAHKNVESGSIYYYAADSLGTSRALITSAGVVCYDGDFYPYGGELQFTNTCSQNYKFQGKERDLETDSDNFGARYYSSTYGRWLSPDWSSIPTPVPYANLTNPQSLNLYAMVHDNPETFADLDGHDCTGNSSDSYCSAAQVTTNSAAQTITVSVTNFSYSPVQAVTNNDGSITTTQSTTSTTTSATFSTANQQGNFLSATQTTTTVTTTNTYAASGGLTSTSTNIGAPTTQVIGYDAAAATFAKANLGSSGIDLNKVSASLRPAAPSFVDNLSNHKIGVVGVLLATGTAVGCALTACPAWAVPGAAVVGGIAAVWDWGANP